MKTLRKLADSAVEAQAKKTPALHVCDAFRVDKEHRRCSENWGVWTVRTVNIHRLSRCGNCLTLEQMANNIRLGNTKAGGLKWNPNRRRVRRG